MLTWHFLASRPYPSFLLRPRPSPIYAATVAINTIAFIDSQATNFVVPDLAYLTRLTPVTPLPTVDTANGPTVPAAIGDAHLSILDDAGYSHTFQLTNVWVIPSCSRVLYSQPHMHSLGIIHRLDEGYLLLPNGSRKSISPRTYAIDLMFGPPPNPPAAYVARSLNMPLTPSLPSASPSSPLPRPHSTPQLTLWHRLGCPSRDIWLRIADMTIDNGLPPQPHLRHTFPMLPAIANARARILPFHNSRDPDQLPAPGALIHLDFEGPLTPSFPHHYTCYCGAVDAGSGLMRLLPCHSPSKETAQRCLELLLTDLRMNLGLTHKLLPHVITTDQGSQFMSHYFRDFLSAEQIRHWPAVVYTPQQNALVERMWGTRFSTARVLLKLGEFK